MDYESCTTRDMKTHDFIRIYLILNNSCSSAATQSLTIRKPSDRKLPQLNALGLWSADRNNYTTTSTRNDLCEIYKQINIYFRCFRRRTQLY